MTETTGAGSHKLECTSSKGEEALNCELGNEILCILPYKQWVKVWSTTLVLFCTNLILGNKLLRAWSLGWPSLICQRVLLKTDNLETLMQALDDKKSWEASWG